MPAADGVLLADPLAIRARRFRAVFVCGLQEGELPQRPRPGAVPGRRRPRGAGEGLRPRRCRATRTRCRASAACSTPASVAPRGGAVPLVPQLRRGGRAAAAVAVPGRRPRALHRRAVGGPRPPAAGRDHVAAGRGADAARAAPLAGGRARSARRPRRSTRPRDPVVLAMLAAARPRVRPRAGDVRRLPGPVADRARPAPGPGRPGPRADAPRLARPRRARAHAARPQGSAPAPRG